MDDQHAVIASLRNAVSALPDDLALRMHLARLLLTAGQPDEAVTHLGAVLQADPGNCDALTLLATRHAQASAAADAAPAAEARPAAAGHPAPSVSAQPAEFDWAEAEAELSDVLPPMFVTPDGSSADDSQNQQANAFNAERPGLLLADVAGMAEVKARLEAAFLAPMRNPELRKLYGKSLRGGLLLYGP